MEAQFINPVIASVVNVLTTMSQIKPSTGLPIRKKAGDFAKGKNITGLMTMVGKKEVIANLSKRVSASIALTFSEEAILHIAKKMMPMEITKIDGIVIDLAGEIANMVLGGAKTELEEKGYIFQMSLPTIIIGTDYLIAHKIKSPIINVPFSMPEGNFYVEVGYEET